MFNNSLKQQPSKRAVRSLSALVVLHLQKIQKRARLLGSASPQMDRHPSKTSWRFRPLANRPRRRGAQQIKNLLVVWSLVCLVVFRGWEAPFIYTLQGHVPCGGLSPQRTPLPLCRCVQEKPKGNHRLKSPPPLNQRKETRPPWTLFNQQPSQRAVWS